MYVYNINRLTWVRLHKGENITKCIGIDGQSLTPRCLKGIPYLSLSTMRLWRTTPRL